MAAAMREGSRRSPTSRSSGKPKVTPTRKKAVKSKKPYFPGKLTAARSLGLAPLTAATLAAVLVFAAMAAAVAIDPRVHQAIGNARMQTDQRLTGLGLKVETLTIQGATPTAQNDIIKAANLTKDEPILHLDLPALRARVENVGWVKSAKVVRLLPGTVVIAVTQRQTLAVWQHAGRSLVIDSDGRAIPEADPARFADLPLVVGEGADEAAPSILPIVKARPRLMERLDALVRVDDRRWDLRTKDGALIQLPADGEAAALERLDRLDEQSRILDLGFERIDLRDPDLVAVRPRDSAPAPGQLVANGA
jgi:cell division protein FtsQ